MRIPLVDLHAQYLAHRTELDAAISAVIEKTAFIGGDFVRRFEQAFSQAYGVKHCIGVGNGTDAIYVVLRMLGIGAGDEVITTAASWISTSETISQTGAQPVFVDVDEYYNIDVSQVETRITDRTKAILPVHLYGQAAQIDVLKEVACAHDLALIEDCAQAVFAERRGQRVGTVGVAGTFSFYPGKNLGAYGDAGAIVTNDDDLATRCRMYANHGALTKHHHLMEGINSRLDGLQAAILCAKLPHLPQWTEARRRIAKRYDDLLANVSGVTCPRVQGESTHVFHLYVIRCERRDALKAWLGNRQIETGIHYPTALPLLPAYQRMHLNAEDFPRAARNQAQILSLPLYPEMTDAMVFRVVESIREFYATAAVSGS